MIRNKKDLRDEFGHYFSESWIANLTYAEAQEYLYQGRISQSDFDSYIDLKNQLEKGE